MTSWDDVQSGLEFVARLNPAIALQEAGREAAETTNHLVEDIRTRGKENQEAIERAKGELAQAKASGV